MIVLLDTHALLWALLDPTQLSRTAAEIIESESNVILVSAASAWEISTKVRLGRLEEAQELEQNFQASLHGGGYTLRAIEVQDALRAGRLPGPHGDPFDRMIAAQALADDISVISIDKKLDQFKVRRIW